MWEYVNMNICSNSCALYWHVKLGLDLQHCRCHPWLVMILSCPRPVNGIRNLSLTWQCPTPDVSVLAAFFVLFFGGNFQYRYSLLRGCVCWEWRLMNPGDVVCLSTWHSACDIQIGWRVQRNDKSHRQCCMFPNTAFMHTHSLPFPNLWPHDPVFMWP